MELVYALARHVAVAFRNEYLRGPANPGPPATNTRSATPRKDQAQVADKGKSKKVDKGKGKMIEPEKVVYPIMTSGAFKIHEWKAPTPPASLVVLPTKKSPAVERKKKVEVPPRVARVLKLADEEESEAEMPIGSIAEPTPLVLVPTKKSDVQVIKAPLAKRRKLKKAAEPAARVTEPVAPVIEPVARVIKTAASTVKAMNVTGFLVVQRKQAPPPSVPRMADVEAFLANEPVLAVPVKVLEPVAKEPLQAPEGPIPSLLNHPLGSNIQHILEDIDMDSEESVGMADDNIGPFGAAAAKTPQKPLSPISEAGSSSRASTPKRPQSPTHARVDRALGSKRPRASDVPKASGASDSESSAEIQPERANWMIGGRLAKLGGDLKVNPFKAMVDLINHEKLKMNGDVSARGMA
jgi:hypothetical protein